MSTNLCVHEGFALPGTPDDSLQLHDIPSEGTSA